MTRSIQQIKQDLASLEETTSQMSLEFRSIYTQYFQTLSQVVSKQLMLSVYQICTRIYPDTFLKLSFAQRQKLQENIKEICKQVQVCLLECLDVPIKSAKPETVPNLEDLSHSFQKQDIAQDLEDLNQVEQFFHDLSSGTNGTLNEEDAIDQDNAKQTSIASSSEAENEDELNNLELVSVNASDLDDRITDLTDLEDNQETDTENLQRSEPVDNLPEKITTPEQLEQWHKKVEKGIRTVLEVLSKGTNQCLQEAGVIPNRLPGKVMEVAMQAEEDGVPMTNALNLPNILNLVVETESKTSSKKTKIAQISVLRLRLSEIEFAEPSLSLDRDRIRQFSAKVEQLKQQYKKKKQQCSIAEAEAAWRSSWYED